MVYALLKETKLVKKIMPFTTKVGHLAKLLSVRLFFSLSPSLMPPVQKNGAFRIIDSSGITTILPQVVTVEWWGSIVVIPLL